MQLIKRLEEKTKMALPSPDVVASRIHAREFMPATPARPGSNEAFEADLNDTLTQKGARAALEAMTTPPR
jgi:hypothetical protein